MTNYYHLTKKELSFVSSIEEPLTSSRFMKLRLPRKLKKSIYTNARLFDKSLGFKCRRSVMLAYVRFLYYRRLYGFRFNYSCPITLDSLRISMRFEDFLSHISF